MASNGHDVEIRTGRRNEDGKVRLSVFMDEMLALTLEGHGERAPTFLLTIEQARRLQEALERLISLAEDGLKRDQSNSEAWKGDERRRLTN